MDESERTSGDTPMMVPSALLCDIDIGYSWSNLYASQNALLTCAILKVGLPTSLSAEWHRQGPAAYMKLEIHTWVHGILDREHVVLLLPRPTLALFGQETLKQHRHDRSSVVEVQAIILEEAQEQPAQ